MLRKFWWIAPVLVAFVGCGGDQPAATTADTPASDQSIDANPAAPSAGVPSVTSAETPKEGEAGATAVTLTPDEVAEIKALPEDEQTIALAQKVCPVSADPADLAEGHLGAMGKPVKKVVNGKTVFLCCKGCEKEFNADPESFLAKAEAAKGTK